MLAASDFLTVEVWTGRGLVTHYLFFMISLADRIVKIAGITTRPDESWMVQIARNEIDSQAGALHAKRSIVKLSLESHELGILPRLPIALAPSLVAASAVVILVLGLVHLLYTFRGPKLHPRDAALEARMKEISPVLTRETTMWKGWVGFNASHSYGAILFGLVYAYLAVAHSSFLFQSPFLLLVGLCFLAGYVFLSKAYWFSVPFRGIVLSTVFYIAALVITWA